MESNSKIAHPLGWEATDRSNWPECLAGRCVYHATPLHHLPSVLSSGALLAKSVVTARGVKPRRSAVRRDKMLGLEDYIHFSLDQSTPLLTDKLKLGYGHAVLTFDGLAIASMPGTAVLRSNTKSWTARSLLRPCTDPFAMSRAVSAHIEGRRLPGIELLARYAVSLDCLKSIAFATGEDLQLASALLQMLGWLDMATTMPAIEVPRNYRAQHHSELGNYFTDCVRNGLVGQPPELPYD